ncbi:RNA-binding protein POP5 [Sugiyamaella lignohabitans]|uniref:Ribonuclease P/MRP protein subunit POP5 n=1 Tax=Sugiyamaella lignohabitans TaxID=796027 RepID=A0A167FYT6_9ASCO|nr:RNA-binding protein POP5 [Sugiyamaella lignohabitans]ANB15878.1 RNA-binding protein POP5 [Sugiyamaella lignohabitans]
MVRLKTRYLAFEILNPDSLDGISPISSSQNAILLRQPVSQNLNVRILNRLIRESIELNFGDYGLGVVASTITVKYFSPITCTGIVRVTRQHFRLVWAALTYINKLEGQNVVIKVNRVSGTIKKCEQAMISRNQKAISVQRSRNSAISGFNNDEGESVDDFEDELGVEDL